METKKKMGGARPGSGRKRIHNEGKTVSLTVTIPDQLKTKLAKLAKREKYSVSVLVTEAVRKLLK